MKIKKEKEEKRKLLRETAPFEKIQKEITQNSKRNHPYYRTTQKFFVAMDAIIIRKVNHLKSIINLKLEHNPSYKMLDCYFGDFVT